MSIGVVRKALFQSVNGLGYKSRIDKAAIAFADDDRIQFATALRNELIYPLVLFFCRAWAAVAKYIQPRPSIQRRSSSLHRLVGRRCDSPPSSSASAPESNTELK